MMQLFQQLPRGKIKLLMLAFGSNDSAHPEQNQRQHVSVSEYKQNLAALLSQLTGHENVQSDVKVLVFTPPPVYAPDWLLELQRLNPSDPPTECDRSNDVLQKYAQACREVVAEMRNDSVQLLDLFDLIQQDAKARSLGLQHYFRDGLHWNELGNSVVFQLITHAIQQHWPSLDSGHLPFVFPPWRDLS
jgi:lysophospholipase L1-like esterase